MKSRTIASAVCLAIASALPGAGCAASQEPRPDVEGVWSTTMTLPEDGAWQIEDHGCFLGCPASTYEYLRALLEEPANDARPFEVLMVQAWTHAGEQLDAILTPQGRALRDKLGLVDDDRQTCQPLGLVRQILAPLPIEITQTENQVVVRHEEWHVVRTVYMDGRDHPQDLEPSLYGHSVGHYEGPVLVIDTIGIAANRLWVEQGGGGHSDQLRTVERYTRSADGALLTLELTLHDPIVLREPLVYRKVWRYTPDVKFLEHSCETITGQP